MKFQDIQKTAIRMTINTYRMKKGDMIRAIQRERHNLLLQDESKSKNILSLSTARRSGLEVTIADFSFLKKECRF